jgi:hypothetical protein
VLPFSPAETTDISDKFNASIFKADLEDGGKRSVLPSPLYIVSFFVSPLQRAHTIVAQKK